NGLSKPQKVYYIVRNLDAEVCNGGSAQYFVNSSGNHARNAAKAMQSVGAAGKAAIVQRALDLFGPDGPPRNHDRGHEQLAAFTAEQDAVLDQLDSEYYADSDQVTALLADYARAHKKHFVEE